MRRRTGRAGEELPLGGGTAVGVPLPPPEGAPKPLDPHRFEIREMEIDDIAPVYHLGERVFRAERWPTLFRTWDEHEVLSAYQTDYETSLVATWDDRVIGFALGSVLEKPRNPWVYGYVKWVAIDPGWSGFGIGASLIRELRSVFIEEGARMLLVDTEADNEPALRFFRKLGFGQATEHVYLSLNLTRASDYRRSRARRKAGGG